jgi:hypothetical protein
MPRADAFDYSRPNLPDRDLILLARKRLRDVPDASAVKPADWEGDDHLSLAQREALLNWPPSAADLDRLDALSWPPLAIGVWCFPYAFDVHHEAGASVEDAAKVCLKRLEGEGWVPAARRTDRQADGDAEDRVGRDTPRPAEDPPEQPDRERVAFLDRLATANADLRRTYGGRAKPAPMSALAERLGYSRQHLYWLRDKYGIDLAPYLRLTGPPPRQAPKI